MSLVEIRPSTAEDIVLICGDKAPCGMIAYTAVLDGAPVCVAGILLTECPQVFSDFTHAKAPKKLVLRTARQMLEIIRSHGLPAVTTMLDGRSRFLEALGLEVAHSSKDNKYFYRI